MINFKKSNVREATLFDYLEDQKQEESSSNNIKNKTANIRKYYLTNFILSLLMILSVCCMFYVQFKVDNLQNRVDEVQSEINEFQGDLKILNVEWNYLTRPDRLRLLSNKFLKKNTNIKFYQVKNYQKLQKFYLANAKRKGFGEENLVMKF